MGFIKEQRMKKLAMAQAKASAHGEPKANASAYELMQAQLGQHKRQLSGIESHQAKASLKNEFIGEYTAYLDGVLEADTGTQDDVLVTLMTWCIDAGAFDYALKLGEYAIKHSLTMPDNFTRNVATVLVEESIKILDDDLEDEANQNIVMRLFDIVSNCDMPDQVAAKLRKAMGTIAMNLDDNAAALEHFNVAVKLNPRAGVKKLISQLEKELEKETSE